MKNRRGDIRRAGLGRAGLGFCALGGATVTLGAAALVACSTGNGEVTTGSTDASTPSDGMIASDSDGIPDAGVVDGGTAGMSPPEGGAVDGAVGVSDAAADGGPDSGPAVFDTTLVNFDVRSDQITRFDVAGNAVDAHDGHIALFGGAYYLYGTSYGCGFQWETSGSPFCGFKAYSSTDLVHWTDEGFLFDATTATWQGRCNGSTIGCFRPHVMFNQSTATYVLWINAYDNSVSYHVFTSATPTGPFTEQSDPILALDTGAAGGVNNGDEALFVDDDGTGYIAYTDWTTGGAIAIEELDPSYLSGTGNVVAAVTPGSTEAPALFKREGIYYLTYSDPNCGYCTGTGLAYRTAPAPLGPWSAGTEINSTSCGGQPSFVSPLPIATGTAYLFGSDLWTGAHNEATANYYWAPLTFEDGGVISPMTCQASVSLALAQGAAGSQDPAAPDQDNSSGVDGFTSFCDIAGSIERSQSFTATRSGTLDKVSFTSFQSGNPTASLEMDIYATDASLLPTGPALASTLVPVASIPWAPTRVIVEPNVSVVAGSAYAIVLSSGTTAGCYGIEYKDASPYAGGAEAYSNNGGTSFAVEANRVIGFVTWID